MVLEYPVADREMPIEIEVQNTVLEGEAIPSQTGKQSGQSKQLQQTYSQKPAELLDNTHSLEHLGTVRILYTGTYGISVEQPTAIIIAAGPAGLTAAHELLTRTDIRPIVIERFDSMGGISRTVRYKGNRRGPGLASVNMTRTPPRSSGVKLNIV